MIAVLPISVQRSDVVSLMVIWRSFQTAASNLTGWLFLFTVGLALAPQPQREPPCVSPSQKMTCDLPGNSRATWWRRPTHEENPLDRFVSIVSSRLKILSSWYFTGLHDGKGRRIIQFIQQNWLNIYGTCHKRTDININVFGSDDPEPFSGSYQRNIHFFIQGETLRLPA